MQFDNKASRTLGGLGRGMRRTELNMGTDALREIARVRAAKYGADATSYVAAKQRGADRFAAITGAFGDVLGAGVSAGIGEMNRINQRYGDGLAGVPAFDKANPPSSETWGKVVPPPTAPPPVYGDQASSGFGGFGRTNYGYGTSYFS